MAEEKRQDKFDNDDILKALVGTLMKSGTTFGSQQ
jgi:hypothetical protein